MLNGERTLQRPQSIIQAFPISMLILRLPILSSVRRMRNASSGTLSYQAFYAGAFFSPQLVLNSENKGPTHTHTAMEKTRSGLVSRIHIGLFFSARTYFFREIFFVRDFLSVSKSPFPIKMHILMLLYILSTKNLHFTNFLVAIDRHFS